MLENQFSTSASPSPEHLEQLKIEFGPLRNLRIDWLALPEQVLPGFEPSQIAVIVNTLLDAALPQLKLLEVQDPENRARLEQIGLTKAPGHIGQRESYPDYIHKSGFRIELKGLFVDNPALNLKRPPTEREPSARLKENVKESDVNVAKDILMVAAVQIIEFERICHPVITDIGLFPMKECIQARDNRLLRGGGRWHNGIPQVVKKTSASKYRKGEALSDEDYAKDTNFGKLNRVPHLPLEQFLRQYGIRIVSQPEQG